MPKSYRLGELLETNDHLVVDSSVVCGEYPDRQLGERYMNNFSDLTRISRKFKTTREVIGEIRNGIEHPHYELRQRCLFRAFNDRTDKHLGILYRTVRSYLKDSAEEDGLTHHNKSFPEADLSVASLSLTFAHLSDRKVAVLSNDSFLNDFILRALREARESEYDNGFPFMLRSRVDIFYLEHENMKFKRHISRSKRRLASAV